MVLICVVVHEDGPYKCCCDSRAKGSVNGHEGKIVFSLVVKDRWSTLHVVNCSINSPQDSVCVP